VDQIIEFVNANVQYAHWIMFFALIAAGFNLPVSEDALIFIAALLSVKNPEYQTKLMAGVFAGAYISDLICYGFCGRYLGPRLFSIPAFRKFIDQKKIDKVSSFYERYGTLTLLFGRFIPFGVRNALFLAAGLGKMNAWKFAIADLIACSLSFSLFFWLYYTYGTAVVDYVKHGNMALFGGFLLVVTIFWWRKRAKKKQAPA
jgi:membrane protein DedA with SNARE-associated domain